MKTVFICKSETRGGQGFTIKIDDRAYKNENRPVCSDKMRKIKDFVGITQNLNKSIVGK